MWTLGLLSGALVPLQHSSDSWIAEGWTVPVIKVAKGATPVAWFSYCLAKISAILFRALPALNHSIWASLNVWFSLNSSLEPSACVSTQVRGYRPTKQSKQCTLEPHISSMQSTKQRTAHSTIVHVANKSAMDLSTETTLLDNIYSIFPDQWPVPCFVQNHMPKPRVWHKYYKYKLK